MAIAFEVFANYLFRIAYSVYELNRILKDTVGKPGLKTFVMYDIACILSSHLKVLMYHTGCLNSLHCLSI